MPEDFIDTYYFAGRWWNRVVGGGSDEVYEHASLAEAVAVGRQLAEVHESEHFVRDRDCQLVDHRSFRHLRPAHLRRPSWWPGSHAS